MELTGLAHQFGNQTHGISMEERTLKISQGG